jgi:hypothetical protein
MKRLLILGVILLAVVVSPVEARAEEEHHPATPAPKAEPAPPEMGGEQPKVGGGAPGRMMDGGMLGEGMKPGMMAPACAGARAPGCPCPMMAQGGMARMPGMMPMAHHMMHEGMGGQTDPATIGLAEALGAGNMETATMARMLRMRGEILKAIGEIMLKHGQAMAEEK